MRNIGKKAVAFSLSFLMAFAPLGSAGIAIAEEDDSSQEAIEQVEETEGTDQENQVLSIETQDEESTDTEENLLVEGEGSEDATVEGADQITVAGGKEENVLEEDAVAASEGAGIGELTTQAVQVPDLLCSITIKDYIGINAVIRVPIDAQPELYKVWTDMWEKELSNCGTPKVNSEEGYKEYQVEIAAHRAKEMGSLHSSKLYSRTSASSNEWTEIKSNENFSIYKYCYETYIAKDTETQQFIASSTLRTFVRAIASYGCEAFNYLWRGEGTGYSADTKVTPPNQSINQILAAYMDGQSWNNYTPSTSNPLVNVSYLSYGKSLGALHVKKASASLDLLSTTTLRFYITPDDGYNKSAFTVYHVGDDGSEQEMTQLDDPQERVVVQIAGIRPTDLDKWYSIKIVENGTEGYIVYSPLTYVARNTSTQYYKPIGKVCSTLYFYHQAAEQYQAEN